VPSIRQYPFVPWDRLLPAIKWDQGQHVLCVGGTGTGKSTVAGQFLNRRSQVVVVVSKGADPIFDTAPYNKYPRIQEWPPPRRRPTEDKAHWKHVLLWPANQKTVKATKTHKTQIFSGMFDDILLRRGNWCIDVDETHYAAESLKLETEIADTLEQGRSFGISMWNNTQRPARIPIACYVNSSHAFLFQTEESYDIDRLARMGGKHTNRQEMAYNLERLDSRLTHELIYIDKLGRIPPVRSIVGSKGIQRDSGLGYRRVPAGRQ